MHRGSLSFLKWRGPHWAAVTTLALFLVFGLAPTRTDAPLLPRADPGHATPPQHFSELLTASPESVSGMEIARLNLLCAEGLRGSEGLAVEDFLRRLDGIASHVERETTRHYRRFRNQPEEFNRSEGYFRMLMLAVVLQEDLKVGYNPARITPVGVFKNNATFFADARDVFIHGLIAEDRRMGTCASLPVLYVAVARRLGYPVKLVPTQNHLFIRWEDTRERFNVDATGHGMNLYDDNHYRQWPYPITREQEAEMGFLKSMSATDELTAFLAMRGHCLIAAGKWDEAVACHQAALRFSPESKLQQTVLAQVQEQRARSRAIALLPPEAASRRLPDGTLLAPARAQPPGIGPAPNPLTAIRNHHLNPQTRP